MEDVLQNLINFSGVSMIRAPKKVFPWALLGSRITPARESAELSQAELSRRLGVERSAVSYWEKGIYRPTDQNLHSIAEVLSVNVEELIHGTGITLMVSERLLAEGELIDIRKLRSDQVAILKAAIGKNNAEIWLLTSNSIDAKYHEGSYLIVLPDQEAKAGDIVLLKASGVPIFRSYLKPYGFRLVGNQPAGLLVDNVHVRVAGVVTHGFQLP